MELTHRSQRGESPLDVDEFTSRRHSSVFNTRIGARGSYSRIGIDQLLLLGTVIRKHVDEGTNLRREMMAVWINRVHRKFPRPVFGQQTNQTAILKIIMDQKPWCETYADALQRGHPQRVTAIRYEVAGNPNGCRRTLAVDEPPLVLERTEHVANAIA